MSYDVTVVIPGVVDPNEEAICWEGNYTSNVAPMWSKALGGASLGTLIEDVPEAKALVTVLPEAIARMRANPDQYRAMNPSNGWGNYEGALAFLEGIERACRNFPQARVRVWR